MIWDPNLRTHVFVVDPSEADYDSLRQDDSTGSRVVFFSSATDALQAADRCTPAMWVVNMRLPDMSGADLRTILRARGCQSPVALVGDEYQIDDEIEARTAGAEMYFAKPIEPNMILSAS